MSKDKKPELFRPRTRKPVKGTQSIARAMAVLRLVAKAGPSGARLTEVANEAGLHLVTARRLLQAMVAEGMLLFDHREKSYEIGASVVAMAAVATAGFNYRERLMPALREIAEASHDTVILMVRRGDHAVCVERVEGAFPIRVMTIEVGTIRPLGIGSSTLAILANLDDQERRGVVERNAKEYAEHKLDPERVEKLANEARAAGFAYVPGRIVEGVHGLAMPVFQEGIPIAAISIVAIAERLPRSRLAELQKIIQAAVRRVPGASVKRS